MLIRTDRFWLATDCQMNHFKENREHLSYYNHNDSVLLKDYLSRELEYMERVVIKNTHWVVLAAIFGAVVSSLASMLNSASTIATMDIYNKIKKSASQFELVTVGRIFTVPFALIAMIIAPSLDNPKFGGIFTFIQEFQGFISPGVLAIFLFGLLVNRTPRFAGTVGLILNPILVRLSSGDYALSSM